MNTTYAERENGKENFLSEKERKQLEGLSDFTGLLIILRPLLGSILSN